MKTTLPRAAKDCRVGRAVFVLLAALAATACAAGSNAPNPFDDTARQAEAARLRIQIQNLNFSDVRITAVGTGRRVRVGDVTGKTDKNFTLEWDYNDPISFEINISGGGRGCTTRRVIVEPGARVWVNVPLEFGIAQCTVGRT